MEEIKIGHIITRLIIGGAQENTIFTVEGLRKKGYDVTLISGPGLGPEGSLVEETRKKGLRVIIIPELRREINPFLDTIALIKLYCLVKKEKYDIVHTHSSKAGILGRIAAKSARRRAVIIHTIHGLPFHPYQTKILNFVYVNLERISSLFTNKIICVGRIMKEKALAARLGNKEKFVVIYSGFEVEKYQDPQTNPIEERRKWGLDADTIVVGKIGRLFPLKGQEYLLEVLPQIKKVFPRIKLLLVGEGILRKTLEKRAKSLGIGDTVVFTGLLPPEQIPKVISIFDLLVHVSLREGLPKT
ncbi:MAG: glycosyltransferase, partial [Candidatus Omnitrophica bacterium]|nr:glycosyltransferase [Candidatus Omnitrophota bacterium]